MPHPFSSVYAQNQNPSGSSYPFPQPQESKRVSQDSTPPVAIVNPDSSALNPPPSGSISKIESRGQSPAIVVVSEGSAGDISPAGGAYPPSAAESSPIYGLNGVVRASAVPSSINSRMSDLSSLFRRQAELDKSVEGLLRYSKVPSSTKSPALSDFSLSNFPVPPNPALTKDTGGSEPPTPSGSELIMGNTTFSLVPPRMPAAGHGRQASVPLSTRGSEDGLMAGNGRFPSDALRYDVTSFIGGYAVGGNPPGSPLAQRGREGSVTTMQSTTGSNPKEGGGPEPIRIQTQNQSTIGSSNLQPIRESPVRRGQDLPFATAPLSNLNRTNIMGKPPVQKLDISRPLQRYSVEDAFAYERPRDAPVVIDNSGT